MIKFIKELFEKEWDKEHKILCVVIAALAGLVAGFIISPIREGVTVLSNNGCHNGSDNQGNRANAKTYKGIIGDKADKDKTEKDKKEKKSDKK